MFDNSIRKFLSSLRYNYVDMNINAVSLALWISPLRNPSSEAYTGSKCVVDGQDPSITCSQLECGL